MWTSSLSRGSSPIAPIYNWVRHLAESRYGLAAALLLAMGVKGGSWIAQSTHVINHDGALYLTSAQLLAAGQWSAALAQHPLPLFPVLIALVHYIFPDWITAARLVSTMALVLTVIPLYLLTQERHSRAAAFWACVALSGVPMISQYAGLIIRGPLFVLILAWVIYYVHRALSQGRVRDHLLASGLGTLSLLLRLEGVVVLVVSGGLFLYQALRDRRTGGHFRGFLVWMAIPLICAVGALALVGTRVGPTEGIRHILDAPRPEAAGPAEGFLDNYHYIYRQLSEMEQQAPYPKGDQNFAEIARHFMPVIYLLGVFETLVRVLFPVWLIPLWVGWRRGLARSGWPLTLFAAAFVGLVFGTLIFRDYIQTRFLYAPVYCLFPWIGVGLDHLFRRLGGVGTSARRWAGGIAFGVAFVFLPLVDLGLALKSPPDRVTADAGHWLKVQPATHDAQLVTNDLRIPFYAGRGTNYTKFINIWNDYSQLEAYAHGFGVGLIALRMPKDKKDLIPPFKYYREINNFTGIREYAVIFADTALAARLPAVPTPLTPTPAAQRTPK